MSLRFKALEEALSHKPQKWECPEERQSEYFAHLVFTRDVMKRYMSREVYEALVETVDHGKPLSRDIANGVAAGMKQWALEMGAKHYTHWFQPLTGATAEKHETFLDFDGRGGMLEDFSGKILFQQEPDASSFPNGGIRSTFEARGYSAWDPSSPAFIYGDTLTIPSIFISYTGEALDYKTPLLKSTKALSEAAVPVCRYFDENVNQITTNLGWEQEYFLVDASLAAVRPDLALTGRTLMGHESAKNQQLEDHYFGSIPSRVLPFMSELEAEALKLGIPVKTRHNEVAPNQFELAPIFEEVNLANDHNLLLMSLMDRVAERHNFKVLLHEKPFKGINGSGKHNNWSMTTNTGVNLLAPGKDALSNLQFITYVVNVLMAVWKHNGLLKASISSATNAHRLGGNEAPPSIVSVFLGTQINGILDKLEASTSEEAIVFDKKVGLKLGVDHIPELLLDNTDRNRTSPFAFTGNRFEFRAVGSTANCGASMLALNSAVANQLLDFHAEVEALIAKGEPKERAIFTVVREYIKTSKPVRFDGNGYSEAWQKEAAKRGLDCQTSVPMIIDNYLKPESVEMFNRTKVLSLVELQSRSEVKWEMYTKKVQIEARVLGDLVMNHVVPVASRYQSILLDNVVKMKEAFGAEGDHLAAQDKGIIRDIATHITVIVSKVNDLVEARKSANQIEEEREKAIAYHDRIVPVMEEIRYHVDKLELIVDDEMWTLPKYRELLFIR